MRGEGLAKDVKRYEQTIIQYTRIRDLAAYTTPGAGLSLYGCITYDKLMSHVTCDIYIDQCHELKHAPLGRHCLGTCILLTYSM